jgi:GxxExxY protein
MERDQLEILATQRVDAALAVHHELGPGLLESAYEMALSRELSLRGIAFERQKPMAVSYKGALLDCGYRIDLLIEQAIIVELKAVDDLAPIHEAQFSLTQTCRLPHRLPDQLLLPSAQTRIEARRVSASRSSRRRTQFVISSSLRRFAPSRLILP